MFINFLIIQVFTKGFDYAQPDNSYTGWLTECHTERSRSVCHLFELKHKKHDSN